MKSSLCNLQITNFRIHLVHKMGKFIMHIYLIFDHSPVRANLLSLALAAIRAAPSQAIRVLPVAGQSATGHTYTLVVMHAANGHPGMGNPTPKEKDANPTQEGSRLKAVFVICSHGAYRARCTKTTDSSPSLEKARLSLEPPISC